MGHIQHKDKDGNVIPSVTQIKAIFKVQFIEGWQRRNCDCTSCRNRGGTDGKCGFVTCDKIGEDAQEIGRNVHEAIENYLKEILSNDGTGDVSL